MEGTLEEIRSSLSKYIVDLKDYKVEKIIGKGGYGQVSLAFKGGKKYALKELFFKELTDRDLQLFCREVQVLGKCDSPFLLKLNGFTTSYPFAIITDYVPNGSLFEALRHRLNSPNLTATNKTLIALGIAQGMMSLHSLNIIHRDLKSLNILLDERALPHICDFGIAREKNFENEHLTNQIGTPHWMAPETFESENYTNKVDVYSYAILLWEMLTESTPFRGKNPVQIMTIVCQKNERLRLPQNTPDSLANLIKRCWDRDPDVRPTFAEIYSLFAQKKVMFAGTDPKSVDALVQMIEMNRRSKRGTCDPSGSKLSDFIQAMIDTINNFDPENPDAFLEILKSSVDLIRPKSAHDFFAKISDLVESQGEKMPLKVILAIYLAISKIITRNDQFFSNFVESSLYQNMNIEDTSFFEPIYNIYFFIGQNGCNYLDYDKIISFFENNHSHAKEFGHFLSTMSPFYKNTPIVKQICLGFLKRYQVFFDNDGGIELLIFLKKLLDDIDEFETHIEENKIAPVLKTAFNQSDSNIVILAYEIISSHFKTSYYPLQENILKHLDQSSLVSSVISFLKCHSPDLISNELLSKIIITSKNSKSATEYLFRYSRQPERAEQLISLSMEWMDFLNTQDAIYILYSILSHPGMGEKIIHQKLLPQLLTKSIQEEANFNGTICLFLRKLPLTNEFVHALVELQFFEKFIENCMKKHQNVVFNGIMDLLQCLPCCSDLLNHIPEHNIISNDDI